MTTPDNTAPVDGAESSFEQFFTRDVAREGLKVNIPTRAGGPSKHYLILRHIDSDEFRFAKAVASAKKLDIFGEKDLQKRMEMFEEVRLEQLVSLVAGWSFTEPCTPENIIRFLKNAPYVSDMVEVRSRDNQLFFGNASKAS